MIVTDRPRNRDLLRGLLVWTFLMAAARHAAGDGPVVAPAPVGARAELADVTIWSVDDPRNVARWKDADWIGHARLLRLLQVAGLRPRVEHLTHEDFPDRWDDAVVQHRLPELITGDRLVGLLADLHAKGRLIMVRSERLSWMTEVASCADFGGAGCSSS